MQILLVFILQYFMFPYWLSGLAFWCYFCPCNSQALKLLKYTLYYSAGILFGLNQYQSNKIISISKYALIHSPYLWMAMSKTSWKDFGKCQWKCHSYLLVLTELLPYRIDLPSYWMSVLKFCNTRILGVQFINKKLSSSSYQNLLPECVTRNI